MINTSLFSMWRNMTKNKPQFKGLFNNPVLSGFGSIVWVGTFLIMFSKISCSAGEFVCADEDAWLPLGLFCFRSGVGTNCQIHLAKYNEGRIEPVFTRFIGQTVKAPICLTNGVIATSSDGIIHKLNFKGEFMFEAKPKGFDGASGLSGKVTENCIFMTATVYSATGWLYYLYFVDISGAVPVVKAKFDIRQPVRIIVTFEEVVMIGRKDTLRLKIP